MTLEYYDKVVSQKVEVDVCKYKYISTCTVLPCYYIAYISYVLLHTRTLIVLLVYHFVIIFQCHLI